MDVVGSFLLMPLATGFTDAARTIFGGVILIRWTGVLDTVHVLRVALSILSVTAET
jgi:hypothetical protein